MAESKIRIGQVSNLQTQLGTIYTQANNAYNQANSAYNAANNAQVTVYQNSASSVTTQTVNFVNTATITVSVSNDNGNANIALTAVGGAAFDQANAAYAQANAARDQANTARSDANTTFATINTTFGTVNTEISTANTQANAARDQANNAYTQANAARNQANSAYGQANLAYDQANAAYLAANNANLLLGGVITGTLNVTQDIIVGGNIYLGGNTTYINVSTYSVEDSLIYLASNNKLTDSVDIGFMGGKNTSGTYAHTGLARDATDGKWKLFDGLPEEGHLGNVINFNNSYLATLVANVEANTLSVVNGVSGNVDFDNGTLFVDSVGNEVGIGTTNPEEQLHIFSGKLLIGTNVNTGFSAAQFRIGATGADVGFQFSQAMDNAGAPRLFFSKARGTLASPTAVSTDDQTGSLRFTGYVGSTGGYVQNAQIGAEVDGAVSDTLTGLGGRLSLWTRQIGGVLTERLRINNVGNVGIGTTNPANKLDVYIGDISIRATEGANTRDNRLLKIFRGSLGADQAGVIFGTGPSTENWFIGHPYSGGGVFNALVISEKPQINDGTATLVKTPIMYFTPGAGTAAGNVGIGTTNPQGKLDVLGNKFIFRNSNTIDTIGNFDVINDVGSPVSVRLAFGTDNTGWQMRFAKNAGGTYTDYMTIQDNGNIGIGTTSAAAKLDIYPGGSDLGVGANGIRVQRPASYGQYGYLEYLISSDITVLGSLYTGGGASAFGQIYLRQHSSTTSRDSMVINGSGNVGINMTPVERLDVTGNIRASGNVISVSDERVKIDIETIQNALSKVLNLRGVSYTKKDSGAKQIGVIAQEVNKVIPEVVSYTETDDRYSVAYGNLVGLLIEAIKEQNVRIIALEEKLEGK
jgi:hypothetical protein